MQIPDKPQCLCIASPRRFIAMETYATDPSNAKTEQAMASDTISTTGRGVARRSDLITGYQPSDADSLSHTRNTMDLRTVASDLFLFICLLWPEKYRYAFSRSRGSLLRDFSF